MTDLIFIPLGLTIMFIMFVRHLLLLKRIRQIETDIDSNRDYIKRIEDRQSMRLVELKHENHNLSLQIEELKRRCR